MKEFMIVFKKLLVFCLITLLVLSTPSSMAYAAAADYQQAKVSITFDDGFRSVYQHGLPVLASRNMLATMYIITGTTSGTANGGLTDDGVPAMTWDQVRSLQNDYGWEIGSHTATHPELPTVTEAQIISELKDSKAELEAQGLQVSTFATPYGSYNNTVLIEALKDYGLHRGFADRQALNTFPYKRQSVMVQSLDANLTLDQAKAFVDQAKASKQWLVFVGHSIEPQGNPNYLYTWTTSQLAALADYIAISGVEVDKLSSMTNAPGQNLTTNSSFEEDFSEGWNTDNEAQVTVDSGNNGSWPSPTNSVKLTGATTGSHLFSNIISAIPGADYLLEAFVNTTGLTAGEFGFYMDEYDSVGNWISGQWLGFVINNTVGFFSKVYTATSVAVAGLRVQAYVTPASTGAVISDNVNLYDLSGTPAPAPTWSPSPTTPPSNANLVPNPGFEQGEVNWTHDTPNWTINTASAGNEGSNSAQLIANNVRNHLFSSLFGIPQIVSYTWDTFVKTSDLTGEFGFYIDEYDSNQNWISGQWKGMISTAFEGIKSFVYTPTSNLVDQARLQYYTTANTSGSVNIDSVSLTSSQSATPSASPTASASATPTAAPTATPSATPSPTPSASPVPASNLVQNPSFEQVSGTFAASWTQDSGNWVVDMTSAGNHGVNSVKLAINNLRHHLFTDLFAIDATSSYLWNSYLKSSNLSGEFGFYIDEYDENNNWISGQWKSMVNGPVTSTISLTYTPTSTAVKKVRLQYYTTAVSTGEIIVDNVSFARN